MRVGSIVNSCGEFGCGGKAVTKVFGTYAGLVGETTTAGG